MLSDDSEKLIIRKAIKSDSKALIEYLNTVGGETDFLTFGVGQFGRNIVQEEEFISNSLKKENALFIIAEVKGKIVGNLNFTGGPRQRNCHVGEFGVSVLRQYWGNCIGEELIKYLVIWSKNSNIIRKINLKVRSDNLRGIHIYKKFGFLDEGISKRELLINGKFYDCLLMGLIIE